MFIALCMRFVKTTESDTIRQTIRSVLMSNEQKGKTSQLDQ